MEESWLPDFLWAPQRRAISQVISDLDSCDSICVQSPTGSGKSTMAAMIMRWAESKNLRTIFYVNRRLLIPQIAKTLRVYGIRAGIRAADYDYEFDSSLSHQVASVQTDYARCIDSDRWEPYRADLMIVDEAHIQKGKMLDSLRKYAKQVVGFSATPVNLKGMFDHLVVAGTLEEFRSCKALVPCVVKGIEGPDMRKVKRNAVGEYLMDGTMRKRYTQTIVGSVYENWRRFNPDARPTLLYAPGVSDSIYLTREFRKKGVNWAHIDGTDMIVDGRRVPRSHQVWSEVQSRFKGGDIKGISSRFVLREAVDLPYAYHAILATPVGSVASYVQIVGRILRYSPETPDQVLVTDHGGNYITHGSPNAERPWARWFSMSEYRASIERDEQIKSRKKSEPIRCPYCFTERSKGSRCPDPPYGCGAESPRSQRVVIQANGDLVTVDCGNAVKKHREVRRPDTAKLWERLFWGYRKKGVDKSFRQLRAYFHYLHGYRPPENLPYMPKTAEGWYMKPKDIPMDQLYGPDNSPKG